MDMTNIEKLEASLWDPISEIQPAWVLEPEALGSKEKFWYRPGPEGRNWLFKFPQVNTGQHWAEKVAAGIADLLQIQHARVEFAVFQGTQGSASESFITRDKRADLVHGNEVLAGQVVGYDPRRRFRQADHTFSNILTAIGGAFLGGAPPKILATLGGYLVLDAVIGNTDRHHENWAFLAWSSQDKRMAVMAPSFDHASSLGRELLDEGPKKCRKRLLAETRVGRYSEHAHGAIFWQSTDKHGLSPLELVRRGVRERPEMFLGAIQKACALRREQIAAIVERVPADWMSPLARDFAIALAEYNVQQLRNI
jgi:hypothetical protein